MCHEMYQIQQIEQSQNLTLKHLLLENSITHENTFQDQENLPSQYNVTADNNPTKNFSLDTIELPTPKVK